MYYAVKIHCNNIMVTGTKVLDILKWKYDKKVFLNDFQ